MKSFGVIVLALFACGKSPLVVTMTEQASSETLPSPPPSETIAPSEPVPAREVPEDPASQCGEFGGKIHGRSHCFEVSRATGAVSKMTNRLMPSAPGARCGEPVTVGAVRVRTACIQSPKASRTHVAVQLTIVDDPQHPDRNGSVVPLDSYDGYTDFIFVLFDVSATSLAVTIDYAMAE